MLQGLRNINHEPNEIYTFKARQQRQRKLNFETKAFLKVARVLATQVRDSPCVNRFLRDYTHRKLRCVSVEHSESCRIYIKFFCFKTFKGHIGKWYLPSQRMIRKWRRSNLVRKFSFHFPDIIPFLSRLGIVALFPDKLFFVPSKA